MGKLEQFIRQHKRSLPSIGPTGTSPAPYYDHAIQTIVELAEAIAEDKGIDMAAPEPLANTEPDKSAQATIEDKLNKILWELYNVRFPKQVSTAVPDALNDIQAIITTETTRARMDELENAVQQFIFNGDRWPNNFSEYATARLNALQKEQKR